MIDMNICVLGDSHTTVFNHCNSDTITFDVVEVRGATAQGCVNLNSATNALEIYKEHIMKTNAYDKIMIMLGEVDCGYLVWVRSKRYNITIESQIDLCITNIRTFVSNVLVTNGYKWEQIILCGVHLPTIKDNIDPKYLNGDRKEVNTSQYERTLLTLEYNKRLEEMSKKNGCNYTDITKYIIGDDGLVKPYFLKMDPIDHHLENRKIVDFWKYEINKLCYQ